MKRVQLVLTHKKDQANLDPELAKRVTPNMQRELEGQFGGRLLVRDWVLTTIRKEERGTARQFWVQIGNGEETIMTVVDSKGVLVSLAMRYLGSDRLRALLDPATVVQYPI